MRPTTRELIPLRNDRRRRWLADDSLADDQDDSAETAEPRERAAQAGPDKRAYQSAARAALARPLRNLFPQRPGTLVALTLVGLSAVAALAGAHVWLQQLEGTARGTLELVDLAAANNLSHPLAAVLLTCSAALALAVFSLRRHRVDDYHGRYRLWLWTTFGCLLAGLFETTSAAHLVDLLWFSLAAWTGARETLVARIALGTLATLAAVRLTCEIWRSRWAVFLLLIAGTMFTASLVAQAGPWLTVENVEPVLIWRGIWLAGYVMFAATLATYLRRVTLEIEGLVAVTSAAPKRRKPKTKKKADEPATELRIDPAHAAPARPRTDLDAPKEPVQRPQLAANSGATSRPAATGPMSHRMMSRAERRKLKREAA